MANVVNFGQAISTIHARAGNRADQLDTGQSSAALTKAMQGLQAIPDLSLRAIQAAEVATRARASQQQFQFNFQKLQADERKFNRSLLAEERKLVFEERVHNNLMNIREIEANHVARKADLDAQKFKHVQDLDYRNQAREAAVTLWSDTTDSVMSMAPSEAIGIAGMFSTPQAQLIRGQFGSLSDQQQDSVRGVLRSQMNRRVAGRPVIDWVDDLNIKTSPESKAAVIIAWGVDPQSEDGQALLSIAESWKRYAGSDMDFRARVSAADYQRVKDDTIKNVHDLTEIRALMSKEGIEDEETEKMLIQQIRSNTARLTQTQASYVSGTGYGSGTPSGVAQFTTIPGQGQGITPGAVGDPATISNRLANKAVTLEASRPERIAELRSALRELDVEINTPQTFSQEQLRSPGIAPRMGGVPSFVMEAKARKSRLEEEREEILSELKKLERSDTVGDKLAKLQKQAQTLQQTIWTGTPLQKRRAQARLRLLEEQASQLRR